MTTELLGWVSSFILVLTIAKQVHKQWRDGTSQGVSRWLFVGQLAASAGFTAYSWLVRNWVFVVTNGLMLVNGLLGLAIVLRHRRRARRRAAQRGPAGAAASGAAG
jgi:MtN3 and saliva related transmembrane protein